MIGTIVGGRHAAVVGALALALSGACKGGDKGEHRPADTKAPVEATGPQHGGHIKLPSNEPRFTNPILETRFDLAAGLIFEGLVGVDAKFEPVKRLAEAWTVSEDGKVITFKLRQGAVWQDGEKITSKDVAFTFDAVRNTTASTVWKGYMAPVAKLETPDDGTVVVTYAEAYAPALISWTMPILPKHIYGQGDLTASPGNTAPVGSGPFKLARWEPGKRMLLEANDKWWYGRPNLDTIELVFGVADAEMLDALRRGQVDWAPITSVDDWNTAQAGDFRTDYEVSDVVESRIRLIAWNTQRAPLDDKRVRQALTLAMNRSRVIDDVLLGSAQALSGPFFPTMFGADESIGPWPYDLDRAKKLLDEAATAKPAGGGKDGGGGGGGGGAKPAGTAAGKDGKRFTLDIIAIESQRGGITEGTFAIFKHDLEAIGVDLKLELLPAREYFERLAKRDYDGDYFGWLPDIPDPDPYALLDSSQIGTGPNYAAYANPDVDKLLEQARRATKKDDRKQLYAQIHKIVADDLPYTALYAPYGHYAWSRRLRGVNPRDLGPQMIFPGIARWWVVQPSPGS